MDNRVIRDYHGLPWTGTHINKGHANGEFHTPLHRQFYLKSVTLLWYAYISQQLILRCGRRMPFRTVYLRISSEGSICDFLEGFAMYVAMYVDCLRHKFSVDCFFVMHDRLNRDMIPVRPDISPWYVTYLYRYQHSHIGVLRIQQRYSYIQNSLRAKSAHHSQRKFSVCMSLVYISPWLIQRIGSQQVPSFG